MELRSTLGLERTRKEDLGNEGQTGAGLEREYGAILAAIRPCYSGNIPVET